MKKVRWSQLDNKVQSLLWVLMILASYSVIDYYINYLLDKVNAGGYLIHVAALIAVSILVFGIFTGKKISK